MPEHTLTEIKTHAKPVVDHRGRKKGTPEDSEELYTAQFIDIEGNPVETHYRFQVLTDFTPGNYFNEEPYECPDCALYMYCTGNRHKHSVNVFRILPCTACSATDKPIIVSDQGYGLVLFIEGQPYTPLFLRMGENAYKAVSSLQLLKRFDKCIGHADLTNQIKGILLKCTEAESQIPLYMFAVLHFIDEKLKLLKKGARQHAGT